MLRTEGGIYASMDEDSACQQARIINTSKIPKQESNKKLSREEYTPNALTG